MEVEQQQGSHTFLATQPQSIDSPAFRRNWSDSTGTVVQLKKVKMGNMQCPAEDAAHLASIARDICPFPNYNPSPHFHNMLSINSSLHLENHYKEVQSSLTPKQLEDFTKGLRTTFGREGKVTLGGVGVVALSMALLFDILAKQARGEWVSDSGPIPGLFPKLLNGDHLPIVYTVSEYLRLIPHIANNPIRMREETERYIKQLLIEKKTIDKNKTEPDDITSVNIMLVGTFLNSMRIHLRRITNSTDVDQIMELKEDGRNLVPTESTTKSGVDPAHVSKTRKKRLAPLENLVTFNFNCDPEVASSQFLAEMHKSNETQEAFRRCQPFNGHIPKTWLHYIARLVWLDVINPPFDQSNSEQKLLVAQREDLDLRANALSWPV